MLVLLFPLHEYFLLNKSPKNLPNTSMTGMLQLAANFLRKYGLIGNGGDGADYKLLPGGPDKKTENGTNSSLREVSVLENVCWRLLCFVWVAFLAVQITKVSKALLGEYVAAKKKNRPLNGL